MDPLGGCCSVRLLVVMRRERLASLPSYNGAQAPDAYLRPVSPSTTVPHLQHFALARPTQCRNRLALSLPALASSHPAADWLGLAALLA